MPLCRNIWCGDKALRHVSHADGKAKWCKNCSALYEECTIKERIDIEDASREWWKIYLNYEIGDAWEWLEKKCT